MIEKNATHDLTILIPTTGQRVQLLAVIEQLFTLAQEFSTVRMNVIVSFNIDPLKPKKVYCNLSDFHLDNFTASEIYQDEWRIHAEEHLIYLLDWSLTNVTNDNSIIWFLTDYDPLIRSGFEELLKFLSTHSPDIFFVNNVWGDLNGEVISALAYPVNAQVWKGTAKDLFCGLGFEHAVTNIGTFFFRRGFLTEFLVQKFRNTYEREHVSSHAWWLFEACSQADVYLVATPIVVNKFQPHNFDDAATWKKATSIKGQPAKYPWTIGYLSQLAYFLNQGLLTMRDLRTATISEPQRGILLFLDDVMRQLLVQAQYALSDRDEQFSREDLALVRRIFIGAFPTRRELVDAVCTVLDCEMLDATARLRAYYIAHACLRHEGQHGGFSILFAGSMRGYHIYEHRVGFVAVLQKDRIHFGYRDLDPVDLCPYLFFASSQEELRAKLNATNSTANNVIIWQHIQYFDVTLRGREEYMLNYPEIQLKLLTSNRRSRQKALRRLERALRHPYRIKSLCVRLCAAVLNMMFRTES